MLARITDRSASSPVILHAPHGGTQVPGQHLGAFTVGAEEVCAEHARLVDHATDRMVEAVDGVSTVVSAVSRFVVDVERFEGPAEEMNAVGMGVLYTHGTRRQPIRTLGDAEAKVLTTAFRRYGDAFAALVERVLNRQGRAVIVDVHSYPTAPLPYELHAGDRRPLLCIGTDPAHTPAGLIEAVRAAFDGWDTALDEPFRGTYVPLPLLGDPRVSSVMLEIRRDAYVDGGGEVDEARLQDVSHRIRALTASC